MVLMCAALTAIGLLAVGARAKATKTGYRIAAERLRQRELLTERARLRCELAALQTPTRTWQEAEALDLRRVRPDDEPTAPVRAVRTVASRGPAARNID
jgi:hypothetical protein